MARKLFKRFMPDPEVIKNRRSLQMLGDWLHDPNLWHLNRYSVSVAFFIGLFVAFIPVPSQMLLAAIVAVWWRANLPISAALVWITNPLTMAPIYFSTYKLGSWLMGREPQAIHFEPTITWLTGELGYIWKPFLLGSLVTGLVCGVLGAIIIRILWRVQVTLRWRARQRRDEAQGRKP